MEIIRRIAAISGFKKKMEKQVQLFGECYIFILTVIIANNIIISGRSNGAGKSHNIQ